MKILATVAAFFTFLISLVSGVVFPSKNQSPETTSPPQLETASFYLSSDVSYPTVGDELPVSINLRADGVNIVAAAIRIVYKYIGILPILPIDADSLADGTQAQINESLSDSGWVFPVNEVIQDKNLSLITIDLAAVNLRPEGFVSSEEVKLATLDMIVASAPPKITFHFDKTQTKLISKEGEEVKLQLKPGEFVLR